MAVPELRRVLSDEMRDMLATAAAISSSSPTSDGGGGAAAAAATDASGGGGGGGGGAADATADAGFDELLDLFSGRRAEWTPSECAAAMSPEEAAAAQEEELEVLRSIFGEDELHVESESGCHLLRLTVRSLALQDALGGCATAAADGALGSSTARLTVVMPASYPSACALLELDTDTVVGGGAMRAPLLSARAEEALYDELLGVAVRCAAAAEPAVFELSTIARDRLVDALAERERREAELRAVREGRGGDGSKADAALLSKAARAVFSLLAAESEPTEAERREAARAAAIEATEAYRGVAPSAEVVGAEAAAAAEALVWERAAAYFERTQQGGVLCQAGAARLHPSNYVGSVRDVLQSLPRGMCVMSVENVLRADLAARFEACRSRYEAKYGRADRSRATPRRAFHGTAVQNVGSIVSTGLVVPGHRGITVVNGAACGHGIYLAEDAGYSISYCRGGEAGMMRMLVCAALLGSSAPSRSWSHAGHDSYYDGGVMVLGTAAQCLPCYVIHFKCNYSGKEEPGALTLTKGGLLMQASWGKASGRQVGGSAGGGGGGGGGGAGAAREEPTKAPLSASMQASIKNAGFYLDTKRFQVLGCAEHSDDDDDFDGIEFGQWSSSHGVDEFSDVVGSLRGEYQQARHAPPGRCSGVGVAGL